MKRFFFITLAASWLLIPAFASAQGVKLVYRHELHGMVAVPQTPAAQPAAREVKVAPTPEQVIALHEPMARGHRANANDRGSANTIAAAHCDRLVAQARKELRRNQ